MQEVTFSVSAAGSMRSSRDVIDRRSVHCFPLGLDTGALAGDFWLGRHAAIDALDCSSLEGRADIERQMAGSISGARAALERLLDAARTEPVRIWTGREPDAACGACWIASRLVGAGLRPETYIVALPDFTVRRDGAAVRLRGWGEVSPDEWTAYLALTRPLPEQMLLEMASVWRRLEHENAPLRAVVNGEPASVGEDFYDPFILREMERFRGVFSCSLLLANVLMRVPGIGLGFAWRRIEEFARRGAVEFVTEPAPGDPAYARKMRRI